MKIEAYARFTTPNKEIKIEEKNCTFINGQRVPCTNIEFCIRYFGLGIPTRLGNKLRQYFFKATCLKYIFADLDLNYNLDVKKTKDSRMFFMSQDGKTFKESVTLHKDQRMLCQSKQVYIKVNGVRRVLLYV